MGANVSLRPTCGYGKHGAICLPVVDVKLKKLKAAPSLSTTPKKLLPALAAMWLALLLPPVGAHAAYFDFSAPLTNVTAGVLGGTVMFQVFDPALGVAKTGSGPGPASDLRTNHGVVAWSGGATVYYATYDPARSNWIGGSVASGATSDLKSTNGVVTWSAGGAVHCRVYDPARTNWMAGSFAAGGTVFNLSAAHGLAAWIAGTVIYYAAYDPVRGQWVGASFSPGASTFDLNNHGGVVAWSVNGSLYARTYDPTRTGWMETSMALGGATSDLRNGGGVVAASRDTVVSFSIYDTLRGLWRSSNVNSGPTFNLALANSTLSWSSGATPFTRGYRPADGTWYAGPALPLANFAVSTNSGNAPLAVWFIDLSLGGTGWDWNFGDGTGGTTFRAPFHRFRAFGRFTVAQTVSGPAGSHATNRVILTDITAPAGSVVINGGDALTTTNVVALALAATDNSGVVASNRFSNNGTNWSAWETFAAAKTWTLGAGDGTKSVFAQFSDGVGNVSATVSDTITLDSTPLPTATFSAGLTAGESGGAATVTVSLSHPYQRVVSITYAASDGTATQGADYGAAGGRLTFNPGQTSQTFPVPVTDDARVELNETITLTFSDPTNALAGPPAVLTILDNDFATVQFAAANFPVGEAAGVAVVNAILSAPSGLPVSVEFATGTNGGATAGADFTARAGALTFAPGATNAAFTVPIVNDALDEFSETIEVRLLGATNALLGPLTNAAIVITDDDPPTPRFSRGSYGVSEGAGLAVINVWLSKSFPTNLQVEYAATPGSAGAGSDFVAASGTLTFAAGQTNRTFFVTLFPDAAAEADESIALALSDVNSGQVLASATLWILDDDTPLLLSAPRRLANGNFQATLNGFPGQRIVIEGTENWLAWTPVTSFTNQTGAMTFTDATATNAPARLYRASHVAP